MRATRGVFVTGTDTGVGKTHVTAMFVRQLRAAGRSVGAYKPVCSGAVVDERGERRWEDIERLHAALGGSFDRERIGPQCFDAPLAPPVAAQREGRRVDVATILHGLDWWLEQVDLLFVEGVGGLLCPLTDDSDIADLAGDVGFPLLIVARAGLGTLNHTLMTLDVADRRGLSVAGVVLNHDRRPDPEDVSLESNAAELRRRCDVPIFGPLPFVDDGPDD